MNEGEEECGKWASVTAKNRGCPFLCACKIDSFQLYSTKFGMSSHKEMCEKFREIHYLDAR